MFGIFYNLCSEPLHTAKRGVAIALAKYVVDLSRLQESVIDTRFYFLSILDQGCGAASLKPHFRCKVFVGALIAAQAMRDVIIKLSFA